jgi:hypothetical protein
MLKHTVKRGKRFAWTSTSLHGAVRSKRFRSLNAAILDYAVAAMKEDWATAGRLLNRKAPLLDRLRFYRRYLGSILKSHQDEETHGFTIPCPA